MDNMLRKLQLCQLEILKDVVKLCDCHNVKYFLIGGTLLGALRHQGFIPWDDDIDIAMFREDYEKFLTVSNELNNKYFVQNKHTEVKLPISFTKIRLKGTYYYEEGIANADIDKGIFIDIFPLDKIPEKDTFSLRLEFKLFKLLEVVSCLKVGYKFKKKKYLIPFLFLLSILPYRTINKLSQHMILKYKNSNSDFITSYCSGYGYKKQRMLKSIYGSGTLLQFEGQYFCVPSNYTDYLHILFGDYMKLPEESKRISHTDFTKVKFL